MSTARAGWAEVEITPPLGLPMGGRGPRFTPGASVLDPLFAGVVILQDARGRRTLWVSLDLIGMGPAGSELLRHELSAVTGIGLAGVVLNFAHTHSGPMVNFDRYIPVQTKPAELTDYERHLRHRVLAAAEAALKRLAPVTITWHRGRSDIAINRRLRNVAGRVEMRPNPEGTRHDDLWALHLAAGGDRCVLFSHACHPVVVYGFAYDGISADFPGRCRRQLRERLGPATHCQFFQSFAGNVRPRVLADLEAGEFRQSSPADLAATGDQLAGDVLAALDSPGEPVALDLAAATTGFSAPLADPPPAEHWEALAAGEDAFQRSIAEYWLGRYRAGPPLAHSVPWPVGLIRLTDAHYIAWMGGEVFAEWLVLLRAWLGKPRLMAWGYCQQVPGYLPTDELLAEGGYEIDRAPAFGPLGPARFAPGLDEAARGAFTDLLARTGRA